MIGNSPRVTAFAGLVKQLVTGSYEDNLIIAGYAFSWEDYLTYASDEEKIFIFDPTACLCDKLVFKPLLFAANAGPVEIDIYTNVSYTPGSGTLLQQSNRSETSPNASAAILRYGSAATLGFTGTKFAGDLIPSNGAASPNSAGNSNRESAPFEIDITKVKAVGLTNTDGAGVRISHKLTWFEIPEDF